jgi:hypothetical protein
MKECRVSFTLTRHLQVCVKQILTPPLSTLLSTSVLLDTHCDRGLEIDHLTSHLPLKLAGFAVRSLEGRNFVALSV